MIHFCYQCGAELEGKGKYCHVCGADISQMVLSQEAESSRPKIGNRKRAVIAIVVTAVCSAVLTLLVIVSLRFPATERSYSGKSSSHNNLNSLFFGSRESEENGAYSDTDTTWLSDGSNSEDGALLNTDNIWIDYNSYTVVIEDFKQMFFGGKASKIEDMYPTEYWEWYEKENGKTADDVIGELADRIIKLSEGYEEKFGYGYTVIYDIFSEEVFPSEKLQGIAKAMADTYGLDEKDFLAGLEVEGEFVFDGPDDSDCLAWNFSIINYKGKWYAIEWSINDGNYDASFSV